jgi:hypothetical protein
VVVEAEDMVELDLTLQHQEVDQVHPTLVDQVDQEQQTTLQVHV